MKKTWTTIEIIQATIPFFRNRSIENPRLNAEQLLAHTLDISRLDIYLQFERILTDSEIKNFRQIVIRRGNGEPLQYILGQTEFMGLPFLVNPSVLIPRPETELLVSEVLACKDFFPEASVELWDIGTGSGCIAISLAYFWPECKITATDISKEALQLAIRNAEKNMVFDRIKFKLHDILQKSAESMHSTQIIISNPPYIGQDELSNLHPEISEFEPRIALTDFGDGLTFYKTIFSLALNLKKLRFVLLELSGTQWEKILDLAKKMQLPNITVIKDLNQIPRILKIETE